MPTRLIGEQHVLEDLEWTPSQADWLLRIRPEPWMYRGTDKRVNRLSLRELAEGEKQLVSD